MHDVYHSWIPSESTNCLNPSSVTSSLPNTLHPPQPEKNILGYPGHDASCVAQLTNWSWLVLKEVTPKISAHTSTCGEACSAKHLWNGGGADGQTIRLTVDTIWRHIANKQVNLNVYVPEYDSKLIEYAKSTSRYRKSIWNKVFKRIKHSTNPSTLRSPISYSTFWQAWAQMHLESYLNLRREKDRQKSPKRVAASGLPQFFRPALTLHPTLFRLRQQCALKLLDMAEGEPPGTCNKAST